MSAALYGDALLTRSTSVRIRSEDGRVMPLPAARWCEPLDAVDHTVVDRLDGACLDIGCGPGRFVTGIASRGLPVLGIDVAPTAVALTRQRGGMALHRDVFDAIPGAGRWRWALLLDGNVGIGGEPERLLLRIRELLAPCGRVMVEVEPAGSPSGRGRVRLESDGKVGHWFPWAWVALDELATVADRAGLRVTSTWREGGRCFGELALRSG